MSKTRKILGILLAITLIINVFAVAAYALSSEGENTEHICDWSLSSDAFTTAPANGATFTVNVLLYTSYKTGLIQFELEYDKTVFTVNSIAAGAAYAAAFPNAAVQGNADVSGTKGLYKVNMVPKTAGVSTLPAIEYGAENAPAILATVTFTYNGGSGTIAIKNDYKSEDNVGGTLCAYRSNSGNMITNTPDSTFVCGQRAIVAEASTVGAAAVVETLVAKASTTGFVDTARGYVYGVPSGQNPANYFETSTGAAVTFEANAQDVTNGTGATVTVGDTTYTLVIFGDVNGDGGINGFDASAIDEHTAAVTTIVNAALLFAADATGDGAVNGFDASAIDEHSAAVNIIPNNVYA